MKPLKSCEGEEDDLLEQTALARTRQLIGLAGRHYGVGIPRPQVRFDLRGKAAGMALFHPGGSCVIRYNKTMLAENGQTFIEQTVPHEVAHLVARVVYGHNIRPHGNEWRSIMGLFGANPMRCHNFTVTQKNHRKMRYFPYRCACSEHQLSAIRHHRTLAGTIYLCRRCGSPLKSLASGDI